MCEKYFTCRATVISLSLSLPILGNDSDTFIQRLIKISKLGYNPRIRLFMLPDQRVLH